MVVMIRKRVGKEEFPNLSLLNKVVLLITLRYTVRELFSHVCLPCPYQPHSTLICRSYDELLLETALQTCVMSLVLSLHLVHQKSPFLPFLPRFIILPTTRISHLSSYYYLTS